VSAIKRLLFTSAGAVLAVGALATNSEAQFRGRVHIVAPVVVGGGWYYDPFFYDPWYGIDGQWGVYYPYRRYAPADASVRLEVKPSEAEVLVDGYYAGIVDDFDGAFQRLHVPPGEHELTLYLQGYRTVRQKLFLTANNTFKVKYNMEKLAAGEQQEPRPEPIAPPGAQGGQPPYPPQSPYPPQGGAYPPQGGAYPPQPPPPPRGPRRMPPPQQGGNARGQNSAYGSVSIRVQPSDAEVSIDGEAWRSPAGQDRLVVELAEGSHTIEIRKSGYRTYVTQIDVRLNDTTQLNVSLRGEQ